jgi:topoisomerase-4 subunit A
MRLLRLDPDRVQEVRPIVGDVMGKFHPHGDQSIYDALVRLAQDFAVSAIRWSTGRATSATSTAITPPPCATPRRADRGRAPSCSTASTRTRSTSARPMTARTRSRSCCRAPSRTCSPTAPQGIAVGMATSIPPHNVAELCNAGAASDRNRPTRRPATATLIGHTCRGRISRPAASSSSPRESSLEAYETGRGGFRVRARWQVEDQGRGTWVVVVTEIPYRVQKSRSSSSDRRADRRQEAAARRRRARRIGRGHPPRDRAEARTSTRR